MFQNDPAFEFFKKNTGKIEIVLDKGIEKQLSRVRYPPPPFFFNIKCFHPDLFFYFIFLLSSI